MSDQTRTITQRNKDSTQTSEQTSRVLAAAAMGVVLLGLSGITLTGTFISLIIITPLLVLFSPIVVPAGIIAALVTAGFLILGICCLAALAALSWIFSYVAGKHPPGSDQLDYARKRIVEKAKDMKERAKDYGQQQQQQQQPQQQEQQKTATTTSDQENTLPQAS